MSLGKQAAQGAFWNYAGFLLSKGVLTLATLVLARVLDRPAFGLVGMALLVITAFDLLRDFGISAALIYRQREGNAAAEVAFATSVAIGSTLFLVNWLLAPLTVQFFKTDDAAQAAQLVSLLQVLGLSLLFSSLGSTQDALLQKGLQYRRRMIPEVGRTVIKGSLQVGLALTGWGAWSLVLGQVIGDAVALVLLWAVSAWRPTFRIDRTLLRPMLGYGFHIMLVDAFGWLVADLDYLIIGRLLGTDPLAIYTLAFRLPELIVKNLSQAVSSVAFPVVARLQDDRAAVRDAYLQMQHYMLVVLAPLGLGLAAITPALLHALFGAKWEAAIPIMQLLAVYMMLGGINHWPGVVYKALGRPDILNRLSFIKLLLLAPTLWWAVSEYGLLGVAWGQIVVRVIGIFLDMAVVSRVVQVSVWTNVRVIWPPLGAATLMALAVAAVFPLLNPAQDSWPVLILAVVVGAAVYAVLIWLLDRAAVVALLALVRRLLGRGR